MTAQDMFFTPLAAGNAVDLVHHSEKHLPADYKVEMAPTPTTIAGRPFVFYAYWSPVAELHWYVVTTEIRCHAVQIVLSSRNTKLLASLILDLEKMKLPAEATVHGLRRREARDVAGGVVEQSGGALRLWIIGVARCEETVHAARSPTVRLNGSTLGGFRVI